MAIVIAADTSQIVTAQSSVAPPTIPWRSVILRVEQNGKHVLVRAGDLAEACNDARFITAVEQVARGSAAIGFLASGPDEPHHTSFQRAG